MGFPRVQKRPIPIIRDRPFVSRTDSVYEKSGYEIHGISHTGSLCFLIRNHNPCQCKELLFRQDFMRDERSILEEREIRHR